MMIIDNWQFISSTTSIIFSSPYSFSLNSFIEPIFKASAQKLNERIDSSLYRSSRRDSQLLFLVKSKFIFLFFSSFKYVYTHICPHLPSNNERPAYICIQTQRNLTDKPGTNEMKKCYRSQNEGIIKQRGIGVFWIPSVTNEMSS